MSDPSSPDAPRAERSHRLFFAVWPSDDLRTVVEPRIRAFQPDLLLVSAGYDAALGDPLGGMGLTEVGFRELAARA